LEGDVYIPFLQYSMVECYYKEKDMKTLLEARAIRASDMPQAVKRSLLDSLADGAIVNSIELLWLLELGHLPEYALMSLEHEDVLNSWDDGSKEVKEELDRLWEAKA